MRMTWNDYPMVEIETDLLIYSHCGNDLVFEIDFDSPVYGSDFEFSFHLDVLIVRLSSNQNQVWMERDASPIVNKDSPHTFP